MSNPTQTVHIELERREIEVLIAPPNRIKPASLLKSAKAKLRAALSSSPEQGGVSKKAELAEEAYCVEEFLRKVTAWEGSAEDELTEAVEAAEKLTGALDQPATQPPAPVLSDRQREHLNEIAQIVQDYGPESRAAVDAAFLRNLASQEQGEDREPNAGEWQCDSCGRIAPAGTEGWEQTPPDDAGVTVEWCPDCPLRRQPPEHLERPEVPEEAATVHDLKCWPPFFEDILIGRKNFECRVADRDYKAGDLLRLREFDPAKGYTGRELTERVTYVLHGNQFGIKPGHVVMALYKPAPAIRKQEAEEAAERCRELEADLREEQRIHGQDAEAARRARSALRSCEKVLATTQAERDQVHKQERQRVREAALPLIEGWEDQAARRFRKLDALEVVNYEIADFVSKGEAESFASVANALRELLDSLEDE